MILEPDFLTHWKTQMLVTELGDKAAPLYVIALWAHCQNRKSDSFSSMAPNALKAVCRYEGEASKLRSALERCGFIDVNGEAITVHGWAERNAKLIANWNNGVKGGRPSMGDKKPNGNPTETQLEPTETQLGFGLTQTKPIRVDEIDKNTPLPPGECRKSLTRRPTLNQSIEAASQIGISKEAATIWWNKREASEWMKGTAGGGTTPVGQNWRADLSACKGWAEDEARKLPKEPAAKQFID